LNQVQDCFGGFLGGSFGYFGCCVGGSFECSEFGSGFGCLGGFGCIGSSGTFG
jgi:hypothetical protein